MSTMTTDNWATANQCYLMAAVHVVHDMIKGDTVASEESRVQSALHEAAAAMPSPAALDTLCSAFSLSSFERELLLLCAGVALDASFAADCATRSASHQTGPTFGLALEVLPEPHWSALSPSGPLRYWHLIEVGSAETLTTSSLRIDERILHYLAGVPCLDERLQGLIEALDPPHDLPLSHHAVVQRILRIWTQTSDASQWPSIQICGDPDVGKSLIAAAVCAELSMQLDVIQAADIPANPTDREVLARLWEREAVLRSSILLIDCDELDDPVYIRAVRAFAERVQSGVIVSTRDPLRMRRRPLIRFDVERPSPAEQQTIWKDVLGSTAHVLNGQLDALIAQFSLSTPDISIAAAEVLGEADQQADALGKLLWDSCRAQARPQMDDLAQRITPTATWDDLILPEPQRQTLHTIAAHVRQRATVYEHWGFAGKSARGLGISALFAGASGTGKTMAAEVLANELRLDLYRIDLSLVVSKYIGETEKNLRRVFDAAEAGGAILLFDEADALFGKRSEIKDSHDRYANIEVSYLLQRMETYRGLAILTTNMHEALDPAFLRRLRFVVQFPFPDASQRAEIWKRIFPLTTPVEGLDVLRLAQLNVAGGNIRNIALNAAFFAADHGEPVQMRHLLQAAHVEYAKLERSLTESELRGWNVQ